MSQQNLIHWADGMADRIIKQKGEKEQYVLASGITPSGTVHFGNFREVITVDFVARALRDRGKKVRFIFSWDDFDTFRKIPKNMPKQELLKDYMFQPIVDTPDPYGDHESYAAHHEQTFEAQLSKMGIDVEPIYQARMYRSGKYHELIKLTLKKKAEIKAILNQYRTSPLPESWQPISIYSTASKTDKIKDIEFDGDDTLSYIDERTGERLEQRINGATNIKLPWRLDWPMRWAYEEVDFEPGGKDHSSQGGSYTTAKEIVQKIYNGEVPLYLQYDFVSVKGMGGKMSSSKGDLVTVDDVLKVYEPEMIRWIFASYKSNVDFAISFDLDVIKMYEDYDRMERLALGLEAGNEKKQAMAKRVYQLSRIETKAQTSTFQPSFRHLCNILQINGGHFENSLLNYEEQIKSEQDKEKFYSRAKRAWYWLENYAPDDFKFTLNSQPLNLNLDDKMKNFLSEFCQFLEKQLDKIESDKDLHEEMYRIIHERHLEPSEVFTTLYRLLIDRDKGPKLAGFIRIVGKQRVLQLLSAY